MKSSLLQTILLTSSTNNGRITWMNLFLSSGTISTSVFLENKTTIPSVIPRKNSSSTTLNRLHNHSIRIWSMTSCWYWTIRVKWMCWLRIWTIYLSVCLYIYRRMCAWSARKAGYLLSRKTKASDCLWRFPITITCEIFHIVALCFPLYHYFISLSICKWEGTKKLT